MKMLAIVKELSDRSMHYLLHQETGKVSLQLGSPTRGAHTHVWHHCIKLYNLRLIAPNYRRSLLINGMVCTQNNE